MTNDYTNVQMIDASNKERCGTSSKMNANAKFHLMLTKYVRVKYKKQWVKFQHSFSEPQIFVIRILFYLITKYGWIDDRYASVMHSKKYANEFMFVNSSLVTGKLIMDKTCWLYIFMTCYYKFRQKILKPEFCRREGVLKNSIIFFQIARNGSHPNYWCMHRLQMSYEWMLSSTIMLILLPK